MKWMIIFILTASQLQYNNGVAFALSSNKHHSYLDSLKPTSSDSFGSIDKGRQNEGHGDDFLNYDCAMEDVIARTPDDHYAKDHPGAGWAGYKHPMYGGYLDHLSTSPSDCDDTIQ